MVKDGKRKMAEGADYCVQCDDRKSSQPEETTEIRGGVYAA